LLASSAIAILMGQMRLMTLLHSLFQSPPAWQGYDEGNGSGEDIAEEKEEKHQDRLGSNNDEKDNGNYEETKRLALDQSRVLEGVILEVGDHEEGKKVDEAKNCDFLVRTGPAEMVEEKNGGRDHARRCRDGEADKTLALDGVHLDIEARQSQGATDHEKKGRQPAEAAERLERPGIHEESGRHSECDQVSQGVVLHAEFAGGAGKAGHLAVQTVENGRDQHPYRSGPEITVHGGDHAVKTGKEAPCGKEVGKDIYPLPHALGHIDLFVVQCRYPSIVSPATVLSPIFTRRSEFIGI